MRQGFRHFSGLLHNFVLVKLVTSSIRVNYSVPGANALDTMQPVSIIEYGGESYVYIIAWVTKQNTIMNGTYLYSVC